MGPGGGGAGCRGEEGETAMDMEEKEEHEATRSVNGKVHGEEQQAGQPAEGVWGSIKSHSYNLMTWPFHIWKKPMG